MSRGKNNLFNILTRIQIVFLLFISLWSSSNEIISVSQKSKKIEEILKRNTSWSKNDFDINLGTALWIQNPDDTTPKKYIIQRGDTLSQIAQKTMGSPVFTPQGSLEKLMKLNPQLVKKSKNISRVISSTPETLETPSESKNLYNRFNLAITGNYWAIKGQDKSTGKSATIVSRLSPGFQLSFSQDWEKEMKTDFGLMMTKHQVIQPENRSMNETTFTSTGLYFQIQGKVNPRLTWNSKAEYSENLFLHSVSTSEIKVSRIALPSVEAGFRWVLLESSDEQSFGLNSAVGLLLPGSSSELETKMGTLYRLGVDSRISKSFPYYSIGAFYEAKNEKTTLSEQSESKVYLQFQISIPVKR